MTSAPQFQAAFPYQNDVLALPVTDLDSASEWYCDARHELLSARSENEAFLSYEPGKQYAVCFPDGGAVDLDLSAADGDLKRRWLNVAASEWQDMSTVQGGRHRDAGSAGRRTLVCLITK